MTLFTLRAHAAPRSCRATFIFFLSTSQILDVSPKQGPTTGGYILHIRGSRFGDSSPIRLTIFVGASPCNASEWLSSTLLRCMVPAGTGLGHDVVAHFGTRRVLQRGAFSYEPASLLQIFRTTSGQTTEPASVVFAGDLVRVVGRNLGHGKTNDVPASAFLCQFDNVVTTGVVLADHEATCRVPVLSQRQRIAVAVSNDGVRFSRSLTVELHDASIFAGLTPASLVGYSSSSVPSTIVVLTLVSDAERDAIEEAWDGVEAYRRHLRLLPHTELQHIMLFLDDGFHDDSDTARRAVWTAVQQARTEARGPIVGIYSWWTQLVSIVSSQWLRQVWTLPMSISADAAVEHVPEEHPDSRVEFWGSPSPIVFTSGYARSSTDKIHHPFVFRASVPASIYFGTALAELVAEAQGVLQDRGYARVDDRGTLHVSAIAFTSTATSLDEVVGFTSCLTGYHIAVDVVIMDDGPPHVYAEFVAELVIIAPELSIVRVQDAAALVVALEVYESRTLFYTHKEGGSVHDMLLNSTLRPPFALWLGPYYEMDIINADSGAALRGCVGTELTVPETTRTAQIEGIIGNKFRDTYNMDAFNAIIITLAAAHKVLTRSLPGQLPSNSTMLFGSVLADELPYLDLKTLTTAVERFEPGKRDAVANREVGLFNLGTSTGEVETKKVGTFSVLADALASLQAAEVVFPFGPWTLADRLDVQVGYIFSCDMLANPVAAHTTWQRVSGVIAAATLIRQRGTLGTVAHTTSVALLCNTSSFALPTLLDVARNRSGESDRTTLVAAVADVAGGGLAEVSSQLQAQRMPVMLISPGRLPVQARPQPGALADVRQLFGSERTEASALARLLGAFGWYRIAILCESSRELLLLCGQVRERAAAIGVDVLEHIFSTENADESDQVHSVVQKWHEQAQVRVIFIATGARIVSSLIPFACDLALLCDEADGFRWIASSFSLDAIANVLEQLTHVPVAFGLAAGAITSAVTAQAREATLLAQFVGADPRVCDDADMGLDQEICEIENHLIRAAQRLHGSTNVEGLAVFSTARDAALAKISRQLVGCGVNSTGIPKLLLQSAVARILQQPECEGGGFDRPPAHYLTPIAEVDALYYFDAGSVGFELAALHTASGRPLMPRRLAFFASAARLAFDGAACGRITFPEGHFELRNAPLAIYAFTPTRGLVEVVPSSADGDVGFAFCSIGTARLRGLECEPCPVNTYSPEQGDVFACIPCPFVSDGSERLVTEGQVGATSVAQCKCPRGYFVSPELPAFSRLGGAIEATGSVTPDALTACVRCDAGLMCDAPGMYLHTVGTRAGYWRGHPNASITQQCAYAERCNNDTRGPPIRLVPGTWQGETWRYTTFCARGYVGPMCDSCDTGFARGISDKQAKPCQECPAVWFVWFLISLQATYFVVLVYLFKGSLSKATSAVVQRKAINLRSLLTFMQVNAIIMRYGGWTSPLKVHTPMSSYVELSQVLDSLSSAVFLWSAPVACIAPDGLSPTMAQLLALGLVPVAFSILSMLLILLLAVLRRACGKRHTRFGLSRIAFRTSVPPVALFDIHSLPVDPVAEATARGTRLSDITQSLIAIVTATLYLTCTCRCSAVTRRGRVAGWSAADLSTKRALCTTVTQETQTSSL